MKIEPLIDKKMRNALLVNHNTSRRASPRPTESSVVVYIFFFFFLTTQHHFHFDCNPCHTEDGRVNSVTDDTFTTIKQHPLNCVLLAV